MKEEIELRIVKEADPAEILALYRHPGWWQTDDNPQYLTMVQGIVANSFCFVTARLNGKLVGMGRAISDGCSDAYIQDVVVYSEFRGQGIGGRIVAKLVEFLRAKGIQWIGLISEPGHEDFYERLGFARMQDYTPMLLKME
ncbi:MAG TPA: GNAT family N-acetyltransferase [Candidatus Syntrophosphaera sp.]|jgi:spermidine synthase|nr:MAG: putative acetyltransferase [Candidatus Cloacimonetes bacterium ADurb.Bin117]HNU53735.1 GNAT family N-acetyltransferase [Candidatus Syntrophosphaera sp.]HOG31736.1 GNAT family N-acetyltransferase [Candidatus Cloacimonadota bacterium]HOR03350.1 GNAT family N-acetyltransferase [Candidatus Syntrophosphaera sp.]HPK83652.1 GNAT family N-acetyltransferase [Candidatus Syntrophosphaera sp.]